MAAPAAQPVRHRPFASVVLRTQGRRPRGLAQALACLAAQDDADFEVVLAVHTADERDRSVVMSTVAALSPMFSPRVRTIVVSGAGRSTPLNAGLNEASGSYAIFLDDDDLVAPSWVSAFRGGATKQSGSVIRAECAEQAWYAEPSTGDPIEPAGPVRNPWSREWDLLLQIHHNETPICSFALPVEELRRRSLRFDETLPVLEDWDLLMRAAFAFGVVDVPQCTSTYRRLNVGASRSEHSDRVWAETIPRVRRGWEIDGLALPAGWATCLALAHETEVKLREATGQLVESVGRLNAENEALRARVHAVEASRWWRLTRPLRLVTGLVRGTRIPRT